MTGSTTSTTAGRLHDLDAMRSVLMLLGVWLHAANPYLVTAEWLVDDPRGSRFFDILVAVIHAFRLPAFFVVAGYFAMFSLLRRPTGEFARERSVRLLLPCLATLLLLNIPQHLFLANSPPGSTVAVGTPLSVAWWNGELVGHLWFLVILAGYCLLVAAAAPMVRSLASPLHPKLSGRAGVAILVSVGIAATLVIHVIFSAAQWPIGMVLGLFDLSEFIDYSPYFAAGLMVRANPGLLEQFRRPGAPELVVGAAALAALPWLEAVEGRVGSALLFVAAAVATWTAVRICFALFHRVASSESSTFRYLSEASYSIYLLHHIVVVVTASVLVTLSVPIGVKFLVLLAFGSLVSLGLHEYVVRRVGLLTWLFNGRGPRVRK